GKGMLLTAAQGRDVSNSEFLLPIPSLGRLFDMRTKRTPFACYGICKWGGGGGNSSDRSRARTSKGLLAAFARAISYTMFMLLFRAYPSRCSTARAGLRTCLLNIGSYWALGKHLQSSYKNVLLVLCFVHTL